MKTAVKARIAGALHAVPDQLVISLRRIPLVARMLRPVVNRLLPHEPTAVTVRSGVGAGLRLVIDPQSEKFLWAGDHESAVQQELTTLLRPGMVFWDVGAHAGFFTIIAGRLVGSGGRVHAFEPMPATRSRLRASVAQSNLTNVTVHDCAVSSQSGTAKLYDYQRSVVASLVRGVGAGIARDVRCSTLDDIAAEVGQPDVVKIDVEGVEVDILRGGGQLLDRRLSHMIVEFTDEAVLEEARQLLPAHEFRQLDDRHWVIR